MYKHIDVGSWDFGMKTAEVIPVSSRGLTASDSNSFFTKRASASAEVFREVLGKLKLAKDEIPVHLIALGSSEKYGANKNADAFDEDTLIKRHHTFVKNASVYRDHKNKDINKSYGKVAASDFNADMGRVELLVTLNGGKEAAEKNGGLIVPDDDIQSIENGKDIPFSMGCRVARDFCSSCGNGAKTAKDYCEAHECIDKKGIQRFGCKHGLGKTAEDGFVQYVDNPDCTFIDISRVSSPADRTAYGAIAKYASEVGAVLGGAQLALAREHFVDQEERFIKQAHLQIYSDALAKLASIESAIRKSPNMQNQIAGFQSCDELPVQVQKHAVNLPDNNRYSELMHLADFNIVLGPKQFAKYAGYKVSAAYPKAMNGLFGQLDIADDYRLALLETCTKYASPKMHSLPPYFSMYKLSNFYTKEGEFDRICAGVLNNPAQTKTAATAVVTQDDYKAAVEYCLYKVAALTRLDDDIHYVTACIQNLV